LVWSSLLLRDTSHSMRFSAGGDVVCHGILLARAGCCCSCARPLVAVRPSGMNAVVLRPTQRVVPSSKYRQTLVFGRNSTAASSRDKSRAHKKNAILSLASENYFFATSRAKSPPRRRASESLAEALAGRDTTGKGGHQLA
jgi:hypothetical protein